MFGIMQSYTHSAFFIAISSVLLLAGCASGDGRLRGQEVRVRYAEVIGIERVQLPSAAPAGAVVGGFTGLALSRSSRTSGRLAAGIGGAALGGLVTAALEGDRRGYRYRLRFRDGSMSDFITEKDYLQIEDCVAVERGQYANVRRVPRMMCDDSASAQIDAAHLRDAEVCHSAKLQLLDAATDEEIDAAARKISIVCDY